MVTGGEMVDVQICDQEIEQAFCYSASPSAMACSANIADIVYVCPESFDPARRRAIAAGDRGAEPQAAAGKRPFLLIGPGRWGSADPWLGIPVQWSDISGVGAIIEVRSEQMRADSSQGSHFFQNITSLGIPYLTLNLTEVSERAAESHDGKMIFSTRTGSTASRVIQEGRYVRHVRLSKALYHEVQRGVGEAVHFSLSKNATSGLEEQFDVSL